MKSKSTNNKNKKNNRKNTINRSIPRPINRAVTVNLANSNDQAVQGVWVEYQRTLDWYPYGDYNQFVLGASNAGTYQPKTVYQADIRSGDGETYSELLKYKLIYDEFMIRDINILIKPINNNAQFTKGVVYFKYVPNTTASPNVAELENQDPIVRLSGNQSKLIKVHFPYEGYVAAGNNNTWVTVDNISQSGMIFQIGSLAFETSVPVTQVTSGVIEQQYPAYLIELKVRYVFRKPAIVNATTVAAKLGLGEK